MDVGVEGFDAFGADGAVVADGDGGEGEAALGDDDVGLVERGVGLVGSQQRHRLPQPRREVEAAGSEGNGRDLVPGR